VTALERIGFMQGRLSAMVDGKIQAFPWNEWREEFPRASALGLTRIEWTIDQDRLRENPLNTAAGQKEILDLSRRNVLKTASTAPARRNMTGHVATRRRWRSCLCPTNDDDEV